MQKTSIRQTLILEDGTTFSGTGFGYPSSITGEVVFNTGMVGYPESLTDPSYSGQILVFTYPMLGNYGIPKLNKEDKLFTGFESGKIHPKGIVVSEVSKEYSHWDAKKSLSDWLYSNGKTGICGIDTRALTKKLRDRGTMPGKLVLDNEYIEMVNLSKEHPVEDVSVKEPVFYEAGPKRVGVIDCGCKMSIIRTFLQFNISVLRVPWNYTDIHKEKIDGIFISNGPGDPKKCLSTVDIVKGYLEKSLPVLGVCLGNQILALAAGADTFKLKFGHRSQNQPCIKVGTKRCYITSQNHGYAVDSKTIPSDWVPWFFNANDGTNEGICHKNKPFRSVQFHPEASPGPVDTKFLLEEFIELL